MDTPSAHAMLRDVAKDAAQLRWLIQGSARFQRGQRYFMGAPVTREHCIDVLKNGYQRERILAALFVSARTRRATVQHQRARLAATAPAVRNVVVRRQARSRPIGRV